MSSFTKGYYHEGLIRNEQIMSKLLHTEQIRLQISLMSIKPKCLEISMITNRNRIVTDITMADSHTLPIKISGLLHQPLVLKWLY